MQLEISKNYFYELSGIVGIKAHIEKISKLDITTSEVNGEIELNLSYSDNEGMECFKVLCFPFDLILSDLKVIDVNLLNVDVALVEGQGIDVSYTLNVSYLVVEEETKDVLVKPIENVEELNNQNEEVEIDMLDDESEEGLEKIKDDISKDYEEKLLDKLNERNDNVIATKTHSSVEDFLSFFDEEYDKKYSIKSLYVEKEEDLNTISKEYHVSLEVLLAGYDKENHKVMFKVDK